METVRFDLLPFLRVRFGDRLRRDLDSVCLLWEGPEEVFLETTSLGPNGKRQVAVAANSLSSAVFAETAAEAILATLAMDAYSWINVGDIFPAEVARRIADLETSQDVAADG